MRRRRAHLGLLPRGLRAHPPGARPLTRTRRQLLRGRLLSVARHTAQPGPSWESGAARTAAPEPAFRTRLVLGALATWRLTHLLALEDGPADIVVRLRSRAGDGALGRLMDCFQCLSVWVAAPVALLVARTRREALPAWIALSGAACLLEQATAEAPLVVPAAEDPEGSV